jgi:hypothetical protein
MSFGLCEQRVASAPLVYSSGIAFDDRRIGAAAVYCSDGRFGDAMDEFLHLGLGLPRYDRVAVPGGAACLAGHSHAYHERSALERQLRFLIDAHGLTRIVLIAHEGCAFYKDVWLGMRTLEQQQAADLEKAATAIGLAHRDIDVELFFACKGSGRVQFQCWNGH